jgi:hypothetical protein
MGIPFTLVVAGAWIAALVILSLRLRGRRQDIVAPLSSFSVALIALLHSSIDFSLQVAGYSIVVFALLGLGLSQAVRRAEASSAHSGDVAHPPSLGAVRDPRRHR